MCSMCDIVDLEEALQKTGPELFKELYRVYPVADPEDYFKNGKWNNDLMKGDLTLMEAHRREGGAPDPPDMDSIKFPQLPVQTVASTPAGGAAALIKLAGQQQQQQSTTTTTTGALGGTGGVVEIRLIALFVAKWKLDPTSAKECLSKLTPVRRRYVIQQFKATTTGAEATDELKAFIAECEKDGKWDTAAATTPAAAKVGGAAVARPTLTPVTGAKPAAVVPATGLKRPVMTPLATANKRPTLTPVAAVTPGAIKPAIVPKAGKGAIAPAGAVRPPVRPAGGKLISGLLKNF